MSLGLPPNLLERLCTLASTVPQGTSGELAASIRQIRTAADRNEIVNRLLPSLLPENRELLLALAHVWDASPESISGMEVAAALEAAAFQVGRLREQSSIELVWTGPTNLSGGFRSTEQVILDMIRSAKRSIYLVTFAAYKVDSLVKALREALLREVRVVFVLEDKDESGGRLSLSALPALSGAGLENVSVYVWPLDKRKRNDRGQHGALHAKCVLVDSQRLFVSSANMTEFALMLNIELGILLSGGDTPLQVERNLTDLIRTGVFEAYKRGT